MPVVREAGLVLLRTISHDDIPFLYALATSAETGPTWRFRGACLPIDMFATQLWSGVSSQFVVVERRSSMPVGHVVAYSYEPHDGHCFIGCAFVPAAWQTTVTISGILLFIIYLFETLPLRKIYVEIPKYNYSHISAGEGKYCNVEGRLRRHRFHKGEYADQLIIALGREQLLDAVAGLRRLFKID